MKPCEIHAAATYLQPTARLRQLSARAARGQGAQRRRGHCERNGDEASPKFHALLGGDHSAGSRLPLRPRQALGTGSLRALPSPMAKVFRMPLPKLRAWLLGIVAPPLDFSNSVLQSSHLFREKILAGNAGCFVFSAQFFTALSPKVPVQCRSASGTAADMRSKPMRACDLRPDPQANAGICEELAKRRQRSGSTSWASGSDMDSALRCHMMPPHRWTQALCAAGRSSSGARRTLTRKYAEKVAACVAQCPPTLTSRQQRARPGSGYVCRRLRLAALRNTLPGTTSARGCCVPPRAIGLTMAASNTTCAPCQHGSPLQMTSMSRAPWTGTWRFIAANLTYFPERAPASWKHERWHTPKARPAIREHLIWRNPLQVCAGPQRGGHRGRRVAVCKGMWPHREASASAGGAATARLQRVSCPRQYWRSPPGELREKNRIQTRHLWVPPFAS